MSDCCPIIGIPCRADLSAVYPGRPVDAQNTSYSRAVIQSGGIPILIPVEVAGDALRALFERVDGLLFSGGGDIDPSFYHQSPQVENLSDIQPERDEHELTLIKMAMAEEKPFFAICRGIQVMNVAAGGSLYQDLATQNPDTIRHDFYYQDDQLPRDYLAHEVLLDESSLLYRILGQAQLPVNSLHHQALRDIGPAVRAVGRAKDGIVEVLEVPEHPFAVGVQWHPEDLLAMRPESRQIFSAFIAASRASRRNGHF